MPLQGPTAAQSFATSNLTSSHFLGTQKPSWMTLDRTPGPKRAKLRQPQPASARSLQTSEIESLEENRRSPAPAVSQASTASFVTLHEQPIHDQRERSPRMQLEGNADGGDAEQNNNPQQRSEASEVASVGQASSTATPRPLSRILNRPSPAISLMQANGTLDVLPGNHLRVSSDQLSNESVMCVTSSSGSDSLRRRRSEISRTDQDDPRRKGTSGPPSRINPVWRSTQRHAQLDECAQRIRTPRRYESVVAQRLAFLRSACGDDDEIFLKIHQLSCWAALNKISFFTPLERQGILLFEQAFVLPRQEVDKHVLETIADFPWPLPVEQDNIDQINVTMGARYVLRDLAENWEELQNDCLLRRFPPTTQELISRLSVRSKTLQQLLFASVQRRLGDMANPTLAERLMCYFVQHQQKTLQHFNPSNTSHLDMTAASDIGFFGQGYRELRDQLLRQTTPSSLNKHSFSHNQVMPLASLTNTAASRVPIHYSQPHQPSQPLAYAVRDTTSNVVGTFVPTPPAYAPQGWEQAYANSFQVQTPGHPHFDQGATVRRPLQQPIALGHLTPTEVVRQTHRQQAQYPPNGYTYRRQPSMPPSQLPNTSGSIAAPGIVHNGWSAPPFAHTPTNHGQPTGHSLNAGTIAKQPLIPPLGLSQGQTVNPDADRIALHQAHLRSPIVQKKNLSGRPSEDLKLYQYLEEFKVVPQLLTLDCPYFVWHFELTVNEVEWMPECIPIDSLRPDLMPQRAMRNGTVLFRFRCIQLPQDLATMDASKWSVAFTKWPSCMYVSVNDTHLETRRKSHHGRDLAIEITSSIRQGLNKIAVSILRTQAEERMPFAVAIERIKVQDHATAQSMVSRLGAAESLAAITDKLSPTAGNDDEVEMIGAHISIDLLDPFTSKIFSLPVRGKSCIHNECFDLEAFFQSRTSRTPGGPIKPEEWRCPVCKRDARPCNLVIDGFLKEVRRQLEVWGKLDTRAILVHANGSWEPKSSVGGNRERPSKSPRKHAPVDWDRMDASNEISDTLIAAHEATFTPGKMDVIELHDE